MVTMCKVTFDSMETQGKVPFHRVNLQEINMCPLARNNAIFFSIINANNKLLKALNADYNVYGEL